MRLSYRADVRTEGSYKVDVRIEGGNACTFNLCPEYSQHSANVNYYYHDYARASHSRKEATSLISDGLFSKITYRSTNSTITRRE